MFKFFADECVNTDVIRGLREAEIDVLTVREARLSGADDDTVFKFAGENKRILLSFDRGFGDIFRFNIGKSYGVVIVLVEQMGKTEIVSTILTFLSVMNKAGALRGKLAILGKTRIRLVNRENLLYSEISNTCRRILMV